MRILFLFLLVFSSVFSFSQTSDKSDDQKTVEKIISTWADSTFNKYENSSFSAFKANYTDEYNMLLLRIESLEKSRAKTIRNYKEGKLSLSEHDFDLKMIDYKKRIDKERAELKNFKPKVTSYTISFKALVELRSSEMKSIEYTFILNDSFSILKKMLKTVLNENESIQFKTKLRQF